MSFALPGPHYYAQQNIYAPNVAMLKKNVF